MAHKKGLGSSRNGRDSNPKMLGVKIFAGQPVTAGMILVRQRGTKFRPGPGASLGRDDTVFAVQDGTVQFRTSGERRFVTGVTDFVSDFDAFGGGGGSFSASHRASASSGSSPALRSRSLRFSAPRRVRS